MGRIAVRDLVETASTTFEVVVADRNLSAAQELVRSLRGANVRAARVDVTDVRATGKLLQGAFGVICAVHHQFNLQVMKAALAARAHYCDLGGLFHMTRKQLRLNAAFRQRDRLALLGMGAAPGIVNVLARAGAEVLDQVHEIHIFVAGVDLAARKPVDRAAPLQTSYSLETVLDEADLPAAVFTGGKLTFVEPMSGTLEVEFPSPVGRQRPSYTLHSELATLPQSYRAKGVREVSFRIAFPEVLDGQLRLLRSMGLTGKKPVPVGAARVSPRELLQALLRRLPKGPPRAGPPNEVEILRVVVRGVRRPEARGKAGRASPAERTEETLECHVRGAPDWNIGIDLDTGSPPSIAMQLLARGDITARGALPPEKAVPVQPFFEQLEQRGMWVKRTVARVEKSAARLPPHGRDRRW